MKSIWKFPLAVDENIQQILMPADAKILTVALQNNTPTIWAEVEPERSRLPRRFCIYATGQLFSEPENFEREYIGTFQIVGLIGTLVGHVFELK